MKSSTRWARWTAVFAVLAMFVGFASVRSDAAARNWPQVRKSEPLKQIEKVRAIQYLLRSYGYKIDVDGYFGRKTEDTTKRFQQKRGLLVNGVVNGATWEKLGRTLRRGDKGDGVRALQTLLRDFGFRVVLNGTFSPGTDVAVREFQKSRGLAVDGIVGLNTWCDLAGGTTTG